MTKIFSVVILLFAFNQLVFSQTPKTRYRDKTFQFSLFPGISTNGVASGHYFNKYSLNLFGGMSAGTTFLEIGGISNLNTNFSNGLQFAGLANVIGSNAFINLTLRQERDAIKDEFSSDFKGIQFSGLLNFVRSNMEGIQFTGGLNFVNGYASGLQIAGISNMVAGTYLGVQFAGLYNVAYDGFSGMQLALLYNYTKGEAKGLQLALVNRSVRMKGKQSKPPAKSQAFQIGLLNLSKEMDGKQIGLINISKRSKGYQIGLINIFKPTLNKDRGKNNTPIGLINIGSKGQHIRLYANDLFLTVIERTSGSCYNCTFSESQMPYTGRFKVMHQNALIFAYNPLEAYNNEVKWGVGYGFQKVMYYKSSMFRGDTNNEKMFLSIGGRVLHLNRTAEFQKELSLLGKIHLEYGKRIGSFYPFVGTSFNTYVHEAKDLNIQTEIFARNEVGVQYQIWLGYTIGVQLRM